MHGNSQVSTRRNNRVIIEYRIIESCVQPTDLHQVQMGTPQQHAE